MQFDVGLREGAKALEKLALSAMRLEVRRSPQGVVVVDDSYNASPASMKGALDTLAHMYCSGERGGRLRHHAGNGRNRRRSSL